MGPNSSSCSNHGRIPPMGFHSFSRIQDSHPRLSKGHCQEETQFLLLSLHCWCILYWVLLSQFWMELDHTNPTYTHLPCRIVGYQLCGQVLQIFLKLPWPYLFSNLQKGSSSLLSWGQEPYCYHGWLVFWRIICIYQSLGQQYHTYVTQNCTWQVGYWGNIFPDNDWRSLQKTCWT